LVIWAHRRVAEVSRELLGAVEELEEDAHTSACCAGRSRLQVCSGTPLRLGLGIRCCGTFAPAADRLRVGVGDDWLVAPTAAPAQPARGAMMASRFHYPYFRPPGFWVRSGSRARALARISSRTTLGRKGCRARAIGPPFQCPLPPTNPPQQVVPKAMRAASRWPRRRLGGWLTKF
jgi:hypothetical protein